MVLAGPFCQIRRDVAGYDLGLFARRSFRSRVERDATELFTLTGLGLEFFGEMFGSAFPASSNDQVFLPEFGGAMENDRCVAWGDSFLPAAEPTQAEREHRTLYSLHELAHMWFGNLVGLRWWDDLWLAEAFAHFAAMCAAERAGGYRDMWAAHLVSAKLTAYRVDQGPATYPVAQPVDRVGDQTPVYAISYTRGACVLRRLVAFVGEHAFAAGLRAYLAEYAWGTATLADLVGALEVASGRDLQQ